MYEFIFLGIIPGTHIQVTFSVWLLIAGVLAVAITIYRTRHAQSRLFKMTAMHHHKFYAVGRRQAARS